MITDRRQPNRPAPTWRQLCNPLWLLSDDAANTAWPWWKWWKRNPCANLGAVVLGICHKARRVWWWRGPGWTFVDGVNFGWSIPDGGWMPRPFISVRLEISSGWKTSGAFSILTLRRAHSPNATENP